jgi:hypothetical protein
MIAGGIRLTFWANYRHLRPAGWVEFCDYDFRYKSDDGTLTPDLAIVRNDLMVCDSSDKLGRDSCPGPKLKGWVEGAGFVNVVEKVYKLPVGPWAKDPRMVSVKTLSSGPRTGERAADFFFLLTCWFSAEGNRFMESNAVPARGGGMVDGPFNAGLRLDSGRSGGRSGACQERRAEYEDSHLL